MNTNHIIELLPEYLDKCLNASQTKKVEEHLKECTICTQELKDLTSLFKTFKDDLETVPSEKLRTRFNEQIELEKLEANKLINLNSPKSDRKNSWTNDFLKIAASIVMIIGAFFFGKQQQAKSSGIEIAQLANQTREYKQTAIISLMGNKSASKRIQGVNYLESSEQPDPAIVNALADRMLYDENINVRAASVEVLANFTNSNKVKDTFIEALKTEKDPGIQILIIQTLGKIQERKAAIPMKKLLDSEETQPFVKEKLESVLTTII